jgi:hypothetical protein
MNSCGVKSACLIVFQQKLLLWRSVLIWTEKQGTAKSGQPKTPLHVLAV